MSPEIDRGVESGRIIGMAYPLQDFQKNLAAKDLVTKAVADMCHVITQIVLAPFASRRTDELVRCMQAMRETCLTEDEIEAWNECVRVCVYATKLKFVPQVFGAVEGEVCRDPGEYGVLGRAGEDWEGD